MKFATMLPGLLLYGESTPWTRDLTTEQLVTLAQRADELGYDIIDVPTHLLMHEEFVENMGPRWPHAPSITGFLLGATKRIKVLCKLVVPNHNPVELAKALATLDWASGGRLIVTPMVGYMKWEFDILSAPFEERGPMMDEYLEAMIELWTAEKPEFDGRYVGFRDVYFEPKPVQRPLPLWFGARSKVALRRIATHGQGWVTSASVNKHAELPEWIDLIHQHPAFQANPRPLDVYAPLFEADRNPTTHEVFSAPKALKGKDEILDRIAYLASVGVTTTTPAVGGASSALAGAGTSMEDFLERLQAFAETVMPEARSL